MNALVSWLFAAALIAAPSFWGSATAQDAVPMSGMSGAWYDPAQDGQGWVVEVLPRGRAVVYWFTYPPDSAPGVNAWMIGDGAVVGNEIRISEAQITRGARFGMDFRSGDVELSDWGAWTMTFDDCESGRLSYEGPESFGAGEFHLERLSYVQGSPCQAVEPGAAAGYSGSWYDPVTAGQGLTLGVLPGGGAIAYWFTYDPEGNQAWLLALGEADGPRVEFPEVFAFRGTAFGAGFDTDAISREEWGSLSFTFDTCGIGTLSYRGPDEWGFGSMPLTRLTELDAHSCELPDPPPLHQGRWLAGIPMSPGTSEVGVAVLDGLAYVAGDLGGNPSAFLRLDPNRGQFERLPDLPSPQDHAMLVGHGGGVYLMGGRKADTSIRRFNPDRNSWRSVGPFPFGFGHVTGVALGDYIYAVTQTGVVRRFDPAMNVWQGVSPFGSINIVRDHAATVLYRGEFWWLAGRDGALNNHRSVSIFDPVTRVWRRGPSMNSARSGFAAAVVRDRIMVAGGEDISGSAGSLVPSLEVYTPGHGWDRGPDMPAPVHGPGGAALLDRFYVLGGSTRAGVAGSPGFSQVYEPVP